MSSISKYLKYDVSSEIGSEDFSRKITEPDEIRDNIVSRIVDLAEKIYKQVVEKENNNRDLTRKVDDILTSKTFGIPAMISLLGIIFG